MQNAPTQRTPNHLSKLKTLSTFEVTPTTGGKDQLIPLIFIVDQNVQFQNFKILVFQYAIVNLTSMGVTISNWECWLILVKIHFFFLVIFF